MKKINTQTRSIKWAPFDRFFRSSIQRYELRKNLQNSTHFSDRFCIFIFFIRYHFCFLTLLLFSFSPLFASDPLVSVSVDETNARAHFPLQGLIMITHSTEQKVDDQSFMFEGKKLDVQLTKEAKLSAGSGALLSMYSFQIPAKEVGVYSLSPVTLKVGGQTISSSPAAYTVHEEKVSQSTPSLSSSLRLEAFVDGPSTLFIGERTKLVYQIYYNESIDLSASNLPMIHPEHFQKIGDVQVFDRQIKDTTVQTLSQEVEAVEAGSFSFGPSSIQGYSYHMEGLNKIYSKELLKADANPITLKVLSLSSEDSPPSFTGALGKIEVKSSISLKNGLYLGDTFHLILEVSGLEDLEAFSLPPLQCQVGFSGFFEESTLLPLSKVEGSIKKFDISLRPINPFATEVPPIQLSSFDPISKKYVIAQSKAQPITILPSAAHEEPSNQALPIVTFDKNIIWPEPKLPPLEINTLPPSQLYP